MKLSKISCSKCGEVCWDGDKHWCLLTCTHCGGQYRENLDHMCPQKKAYLAWEERQKIGEYVGLVCPKCGRTNTAKVQAAPASTTAEKVTLATSALATGLSGAAGGCGSMGALGGIGLGLVLVMVGMAATMSICFAGIGIPLIVIGCVVAGLGILGVIASALVGTGGGLMGSVSSAHARDRMSQKQQAGPWINFCRDCDHRWE